MNPVRGEIWNDLFFTSRDGLRLHARHYPAAGPATGSASSRGLPVICLPGLTRNCRDFHDLAAALACAPRQSREVYAIDYRGRGRSDHDPDHGNYTVPVEARDVLEFMTVAGVGRAAFVGTSRGGLVTMAIAAMRPACIAAAVLNDIGPVIEREGLVRIMAYVGTAPLPETWDEATKLVHDLNRSQFPAVPDQQWASIAQQIFNNENGRPSYAYDRNLRHALHLPNGDVPELWPQFEALRGVPLLVLRGALSDLLSAETVVSMQARHPRLEAVTVSGQGHAPWLKDPLSIDAIAKFLERTARV